MLQRRGGVRSVALVAGTAAVVLGAVIWLAVYGSIDPLYDIRIARNGVIHDGGARVLYQPLDEPRLDVLAARERLDEVVAPGETRFDQIVLLRQWVAAQWPPGTPDPYPPWDALIILDWIRSGRTGGFCGQYAQVFLQALASQGFTARYVELGSTSNPYAHYVTEVWSNEFNKWVVMDPDYDLHFERDGVPLSAVDVHDALLEGDHESIDVMSGELMEGHRPSSQWPLRTIEFYYYIRFHLTANHLSDAGGIAFDRLGDMVDLEDDRVVPWEESGVESEFPKERLTTLPDVDPAWAARGLNQVQVETMFTAPDEVMLTLRDTVLQRERYEYRFVDRAGAPGPWRRHDESTLRWSIQGDGGGLEIRGVNIRGVPGPSAILEAVPRAR